MRAYHRYQSGRANQLKYREALAEGLPVGSGEIESAHRYVAQKRLKLPGAWWRADHQPPQRRLAGLLGRARRQPACSRKSYPAEVSPNVAA